MFSDVFLPKITYKYCNHLLLPEKKSPIKAFNIIYLVSSFSSCVTAAMSDSWWWNNSAPCDPKEEGSCFIILGHWHTALTKNETFSMYLVPSRLLFTLILVSFQERILHKHILMKAKMLNAFNNDCMHAWSVTQSCLTLCDPMDCSPPASLPMGFFRQEYWSRLPSSFSRGSSWPRDQIHISSICR